MITRLRRRHRSMTTVAALVALVGVAGALAFRASPDIPRAEILAPDSAGPDGDVFWSSDRVFEAWPSDVRLLRAADGVALEIDPRGEGLTPDVLVYWAPQAEPRDKVPESAQLLGRLAGTQARRFTLRATTAGSLYLYSLGHQTLVATGRLPAPENTR